VKNEPKIPTRRHGGPVARAGLRLAGLALAAAVVRGGPAAAQSVGALVSPGALSKAHAKLEGLDNCQKCHEPGKQVTPKKCLACHQPVAERIAAKKGVHRDAAGDCVSCHVEHAGVDAELRPLEKKGFDHAKEAGFVLDGRHKAIDCAACHKTRSFLTLKTDCASCHADPHKGQLGATCGTCHPASVPFKETQKSFDHSKTAYPLTGAHARVACDKCHASRQYRGIKFASCVNCHKDPHSKPLGTCASCHTTESFKAAPAANGGGAAAGAAGAAVVAGAAAAGAAGGAAPLPMKFDHAKTGYPLVGRHASVACASCHVQPATKVRLKAGRCADCHQDVHKGVFKGLDCGSCHKETGFKGGTFDHAAKTKFPLEGKHAAVACASCHKGAAPAPRVAAAKRTVDFRGARPECASCHADVHRGQLGTSCQTCHSAASFQLATFRHPRFPEFFAGGHAKASCDKCHAADPKAAATQLANGRTVPARRYKGVSLECSSCHKDPHLGQVGTNCASCHGVDSAKYAPNLFDHAKTRFPLTGKHVALECSKCHRKETGAFPAGNGTAVRLTGLSSDCRTCHKDVHLGQLGASCQGCHSTTTFELKTYAHRNKALAGFFVDKHATAPCASCHRKSDGVFPAGRGSAVSYTVSSTNCAACHDDAHKGALGSNCASCHDVKVWKTPNRAFHKGGTFPLEGQHLSTPCASCHWSNAYKGTPTRCYDCHWIRRQDDLYRTLLGSECENCHRPTSWTAVTWNHAARTGFPLNAAHSTLRCDQCHKNRVFAGTPTDCYACHRENFESARNPDHRGAGFPTTCASCHRPGDPTWHAARFDHSASFPLAGVHASQPCAACHKNPSYKGTPNTCSGCHQADFAKTVSPNHLAAGFGTACESCHKFTDASWNLSKYPHAAWPLVGTHVTAACSTCHTGTVYKGLSSTCLSCHQAAYQQAQNPNHAAAGFPTACDTCHKLSDPTWRQGTFNHGASFALAGVHATTACNTCHKNSVFKGTPRDCVGCHQADFQGSKNPPHLAAGFSTACETCHKFADPAWKGATFPHSTFQLAGVHTTQACATCHKNNVFKGTPRDCVGCHNADFQSSKNPSHVTAGFPTTCDTCHRFADATWQQGTFTNHASVFPLAGAHLAAACDSCHKNGNYTTVPRSPCSACHMTDFQNATSPVPHTGFSTACDSCHRFSDSTWAQKSAFSHTPYFALAGAHATAPCAQCHKNNNYLTVPTNPCSACHLADYQTAISPVNHVAAAFPTTCDTCHKFSDTLWSQGAFSHSTFTLAGVHATQPCAACHKGGVYKGTPRDCYTCHLTDFQSATSPVPHNGFPTACDSCHRYTDSTWAQKSAFSHAAYFPLAGAHVTAPCAQCHKNNNYLTVPKNPCSACHLADYQTAISPVNHVAAAFPTTCDTCHRFSDTLWSQAVFTHSTFTLAGVHATQACAACHKGGVYKGTPRDCYTCHLTDFQSATSPVPHNGFPTACDSCHRYTDSTWAQKSAFSHNAYFTLAGAHVTAPCAQCHKNNNYLTVPVGPCSACHLADYQTAISPVNHVAAGFPTTCDTCHKFSDTLWSQAVFNHTWFPRNHGNSGGVCASCHTNPSNYTIFSCTICHSQAATSPPTHHNGVAGYVWNSQACYSCHPNGKN
jgi:hypothetical protein